MACAALPARAQRTAEPGALERAHEEANRPMRWIIESSKIERKKAAPDADKPAATKRKPKPPAATVAATPPVASRSAVTSTPSASPVETRVTRTEEKPAASLPPAMPAAAPPVQVLTQVPIAAQPATSNTKPAEDTTVANVKPLGAPLPHAEEEDNDEAPLVVVFQPTPQAWTGFCADDCEQYFYRVSFKVLTNGRVDDVRVVETNNSKLKRAVIQAVEQWRYQPIQAEREEEVVIRPTTQQNTTERGPLLGLPKQASDRNAR